MLLQAASGTALGESQLLRSVQAEPEYPSATQRSSSRPWGKEPLLEFCLELTAGCPAGTSGLGHCSGFTLAPVREVLEDGRSTLIAVGLGKRLGVCEIVRDQTWDGKQNLAE